MVEIKCTAKLGKKSGGGFLCSLVVKARYVHIKDRPTDSPRSEGKKA